MVRPVSAAVERDGHRNSDWSQWSSWPFAPTGGVRTLDPPASQEPPRAGAGGAGCGQCDSSLSAVAAEYLVWRDHLFMLGVPFEGSALPLALFLMPRRHADLAELTADESARQGVLLAAVERAACAVLDVPRIQVARWGDGSEHLHWWLMARPSGQLQLRGTFLSHWNDLLPRVPAAQARADAELVAQALTDDVGGDVGGEVLRAPRPGPDPEPDPGRSTPDGSLD